MRCAVLGSPIAHSLSPAMHRAAYAELGLDWIYEAVELDEATLPTFVRAVGEDVRGFSVTAPLKRAAAECADDATELVASLGVANTLIFDDERISAYNTDVPGGVAALAEAGIAQVRSVRVLGGGATAASMALTVAQMGASSIEFVVRDIGRAMEAVRVAERVGLEVSVFSLDDALHGAVDLLISTVPVDAIQAHVAALVSASGAVFDVVYNPWPTPLAEAATSAGLAAISGLDLLAHQAVEQVELMTGQHVRPQTLREAALAELSAR